MPTVNNIAQQKALTADVSSKIFRTNIEAATQSVLVKGPMETANDMIGSTFGLRSNISEMLGTYTEERESFDSEFNRTMSSLKESSDKLKESVQSKAEEQAAIRDKAQQTEHDRQESARKFADDARKKIDEARHNRQERADQLAEITRERIQNSAQAQRDRMEQLAEEARERTQQAEQRRREQPQQVEQPQRTQQTVQTAAQVQRENTDMTAENIRERIQRDEQSLRGRTEQLADTTRQRTQENQQTQRERQRERQQTVAQTQRERTERFAAEYLVAENNTQATRRDVEQDLNNIRDENANAALSNVRNLVNRFNDAVNYFNENRGMSDRMNALAVSFNDNENLAGSLNAVGITVNDNGQLAVNETRLTDALNKNSANVNEVLGRNGLAGRLDRSLELANSQRENLFPTVTDYVTDRREEPTESLYAARLNQTAALARENASNFVNMFT